MTSRMNLSEEHETKIKTVKSLWQNESPEPSCVSMKSDQSMDHPISFNLGESSADLSQKHEGPESHTAKKNLDSIFKELEHKIISELKSFKRLLSPDYPECSERDHYDDEGHNRVREGLLKITLIILRKMNQTDLANTLQTKLMPVYQQKLKSRLQDKYQRISEGMSNHGDSTRLNEIYTELYITEGGSGEINNEHEVRQIETVSRRPETQETPINCNDIFKPSPGQDKPIRTVLTKGVAGIGKTVSVQKFILDWAEGKANQDVHFIFPLPFRELNLIQKNLSLVDLLNHLHTETKEFKSADYDDYKVMFIFDGLDECRLRLDFQNNRSLSDVTESASVDVLLTNLIKGNLLPSALLWITSRPAAANQIPPECVVDQVTEVRGFNDPQKDEYFRKRINDQSLADRVVTHIRSSRSLFIMCHIPVFCWISATVLERMMGKAESAEIPKTLTQMFTHFLIFQTKLKTQKYDGKYEIDPDQARKTILSLGKLAFEQLEKGNLIFYEEDLKESGIDVREVSVYSGVCTQIFRQEFGLQLGKVYSFVHLSIQEFLAALFKLLSFSEQNTGLMNVFRSPMTSLLKGEVDKALQSENGHWDLFLRFLLGLSLESNQTLLQGLLRKTVSSSDINQETAEYIKQKIRENHSPEKSINLFHCLNELNDRSLEQEVQTYLSRTGYNRLSGVKLSAAQWSALVFVLLNSEEELDEFKLSKYDPSEECLLRLLPVIKASRKADVSDCGITQKGCAALISALEDPHCKLEKLCKSSSEGQRALSYRNTKYTRRRHP
ncbi:NLR family CARD domain-containing protein 3 isoform X1 [Labeo rohita]|uniref:NLR family CARD domain-containing protein 3 isoform X1 n=1 Tax=Labeo rohita TaxID=84645 RepID=UPI0021E249A9|nr:NLR family CARD domain-containing protein 3 isoform X1 [Labeo rohita]XP_050960249.1 NLR family CARD domain-containing protein 3 isoform X1 [Labeo rohita]